MIDYSIVLLTKLLISLNAAAGRSEPFPSESYLVRVNLADIISRIIFEREHVVQLFYRLNSISNSHKFHRRIYKSIGWIFYDL